MRFVGGVRRRHGVSGETNNVKSAIERGLAVLVVRNNDVDV
jgi:hypothetical protein